MRVTYFKIKINEDTNEDNYFQKMLNKNDI